MFTARYGLGAYKIGANPKEEWVKPENISDGLFPTK